MKKRLFIMILLSAMLCVLIPINTLASNFNIFEDLFKQNKFAISLKANINKLYPFDISQIEVFNKALNNIDINMEHSADNSNFNIYYAKDKVLNASLKLGEDFVALYTDLNKNNAFSINPSFIDQSYKDQEILQSKIINTDFDKDNFFDILLQALKSLPETRERRANFNIQDIGRSSSLKSYKLAIKSNQQSIDYLESLVKFIFTKEYMEENNFSLSTSPEINYYQAKDGQYIRIKCKIRFLLSKKLASLDYRLRFNNDRTFVGLEMRLNRGSGKKTNIDMLLSKDQKNFEYVQQQNKETYTENIVSSFSDANDNIKLNYSFVAQNIIKKHTLQTSSNIVADIKRLSHNDITYYQGKLDISKQLANKNIYSLSFNVDKPNKDFISIDHSSVQPYLINNVEDFRASNVIKSFSSSLFKAMLNQTDMSEDILSFGMRTVDWNSFKDYYLQKKENNK